MTKMFCIDSPDSHQENLENLTMLLLIISAPSDQFHISEIKRLSNGTQCSLLVSVGSIASYLARGD